MMKQHTVKYDIAKPLYSFSQLIVLSYILVSKKIKRKEN